MALEVVLAPEAIRDLEKLRAYLRAEVRDAIERHLRNRPTKTSKARIKRLRGVSRPQFRLRVSDIRFFYDVVDTEVHILAIVKRTGRRLVARGGEVKNEKGPPSRG